MINKTLHYFWDDFAKVPPCVMDWPDVLTDGWHYKRWTPSQVDHKDRNWLIKHKAWATLADVARLQAMAQHGGVYLDCDIKLVKSPDHLLEKSWVCVEGTHTICNAALGSEAGNPFFKAALDRIQEYDLRSIVESKHLNVAGPVLLTSLWKEWFWDLPEDVVTAGAVTQEVDILHRNIWYPYCWNEPPCDPFPETVGIHLWNGGWKKK
jgi:hypothetical protein